MPVFLRVLRVISIVWALAAVIGMGQAVKPSIEGESMLADWATSFGWLLGMQLHGTGLETTEGMRSLLAQSIVQIVFYFGWIVALLATKPSHKHPAHGTFEALGKGPGSS